MADPIPTAATQAANTVAKGAVSEVTRHPKTFLYVAIGAAVVVLAVIAYFVF